MNDRIDSIANRVIIVKDGFDAIACAYLLASPIVFACANRSVANGVSPPEEDFLRSFSFESTPTDAG